VTPVAYSIFDDIAETTLWRRMATAVGKLRPRWGRAAKAQQPTHSSARTADRDLGGLSEIEVARQKSGD
jgi:hypothetical protein